MLEEDLKQFFGDYYKLMYYINKADFSKMDRKDRHKFYDWLNKEIKHIYAKYNHTTCATAYVNECMHSVIRFAERKIGVDIANGNGTKV